MTPVACPRARRPAAAAGPLLLGALLAVAGSAGAADPGPDFAVHRPEVVRLKVDEPDQPSLVFLKDNHVFLRAQLDRLRMRTRTVRDGKAELLDPRLLGLKEMAAAIAAGRDTVGDELARAEARTRLVTVAEVSALEAQLDLMEGLLGDQKGRLGRLEADFLGEQRTALVVLVGGLSGRRAPQALTLTEENETWRVSFTPEQQAALEQGGLAQIRHAFVEPRDHRFDLAFEGEGWQNAPPAVVAVEAPRDRLTFLELDLGGRMSAGGAGAPVATVWQR